MEGKAVLFKRFADIDVFDIEIDTEDEDDFIHAAELIAPTFGGINLDRITSYNVCYTKLLRPRRASARRTRPAR